MKTVDALALKEISRRKTFAIISHPDAGKTTITEKLLLFGNAIHIAGQVKAKKAARFATSDWMEIEKQRGISVSSSVMQFSYGGCEINLLDTPGHGDFSEDTYRVLTAVDSALMVIDSAKGIEAQTKKLFQVCRDRHIPILTFINKLDREGKDPFALVDEIEKILNLACSIRTWPLGQGASFCGVYDLESKQVRQLDKNQKIGDGIMEKLAEDLELLQGAGHDFDKERFHRGEQSPVFFGSAMKNFGVQELLEAFIRHAPSPLPRPADLRTVTPDEANFTGVVFKIQANMDPKHRDRCAFVRICSGQFSEGMSVYHVRQDREFKINNAIRFFSRERTSVERAYAGDIIGIQDKGNLVIGDTLTEGEKIQFTGIPQFSPEIFCNVSLSNPIKNKQLQKGLQQLAEEGTSQIFRRLHNSETIIGVVGELQLDVVKFRLLHEYGAEAVFTPLPFTSSRRSS